MPSSDNSQYHTNSKWWKDKTGHGWVIWWEQKEWDGNVTLIKHSSVTWQALGSATRVGRKKGREIKKGKSEGRRERGRGRGRGWGERWIWSRAGHCCLSWMQSLEKVDTGLLLSRGRMTLFKDPLLRKVPVLGTASVEGRSVKGCQWWVDTSSSLCCTRFWLWSFCSISDTFQFLDMCLSSPVFCQLFLSSAERQIPSYSHWVLCMCVFVCLYVCWGGSGFYLHISLTSLQKVQALNGHDSLWSQLIKFYSKLSKA